MQADPSPIREAKSEARRAMRLRRDSWDLGELFRWSESINGQLVELMDVRHVRVLHTYLPMEGEVDIWPAVRHALATGRRVVVPKVLPKGKLAHLVLSDPDELEEGRFGTRHPRNGEAHAGSLELVIVPGLVFDRAGARIGQGAGYYDRFLSAHPEAYKVAVCFPFQIVESVPQEAHDLRMDVVLSGE